MPLVPSLAGKHHIRSSTFTHDDVKHTRSRAIVEKTSTDDQTKTLRLFSDKLLPIDTVLRVDGRNFELLSMGPTMHCQQ